MEIIAHRGNNNPLYKENTVDAFLSAFQNPSIDGIELDVRETKDHKLVVIHNSLINLTSDGSGFVKNQTLAELRQYNFGTKEHPSKISTLKEVLKLVPTNKKVLIELKEEGLFTTAYLKLFYHEIKPFIKKSLWIFSFNKPLIDALKKQYPHLRLGICISTVINRFILNELYDFQVVSYHLVKEVKETPYTYFWTINKLEELTKIKEEYSNSSFGIITDQPSLFIPDDDHPEL